eukprot:1360402-Amorphochlora_amoeboformis.AAC.1
MACATSTLECLGNMKLSLQHAFPQLPQSLRSQSGGTQAMQATATAGKRATKPLHDKNRLTDGRNAYLRLGSRGDEGWLGYVAVDRKPEPEIFGERCHKRLPRPLWSFAAFMEDQENVEWNIQPAEGTSTDPILAPSKPGVDVTKNVNLMPDQAANKAPAPITISDIFEADSLTSQASSVDEKDSNSAAREEKSMLTEIASQPSPLKTVASTKTKTATPTLANPKPSSPRAPAPKNKIKSEEKPEPTAPIKTLTPAKTKPATEKHSASKPSTPKPTTPTVVELPRVAKLSSPGRYSATVRYTPRSATKPKPKSGASKPVSASARPISRSKSRTSKTRGMVRPTQQIAKVLSPPEQCESCVSLGNQVENLKQDVEEYKKKYDEIQAMGENLYASYDQKCSIIRELEVGIEQRDQGIEILTTERDQAVESYERTYRVFEKVGEKLKLLEEEKKGILEQNAQLAASVAA